MPQIDKKSEPKNHHYAPRWYLARFEGTQAQIRRYDKHDQCVRLGNRHSFGCEQRLYSRQTKSGVDNSTVENGILGNIDSEGAIAVRKLLTGEVWSDPDSKAFCFFAASLICRTPTQIRIVRELVTPVLGEHAKRTALHDVGFREHIIKRCKEQKLDEKRMVQMLDEIGSGKHEVAANRDFCMALAISQIPQIALEISRMNWRFANAQNSMCFVTSDTPVYYEDPNQPTEVAEAHGLLSKGIEVIFPLSSRTLAIGTWTGECGFVPIEDREISAINERTFRASTRFVFSPVESEEFAGWMLRHRNSAARAIVQEMDWGPRGKIMVGTTLRGTQAGNASSIK